MRRISIRELLVIFALIIVGMFSSYIMRTYYVRDIVEPETTKMSPDSFIELCNSSPKRVYFYISDKHRLKYQNLLGDDGIERIYISQDGKATLYKVSVLHVSLDTFSGMNNEEIVESIESGNFEGIDFIPEKETYKITLEKEGDGVKIDVTNESSVKKTYTFDKFVDQSELVQYIDVADTTYCGYLHQAKNVDRFLQFQVQAFVTPQS